MLGLKAPWNERNGRFSALKLFVFALLFAPAGSSNNATAVITDQNGTTDYSAADLFAGVLYGNKHFTSALWPDGTDFILDFGFGIDSSLTVAKGWDNATGYGTPYGLTFINAVTAAAK